jgi:hypothetical protein
MMSALTQLSNRPAAVDCLVKNMPLLRRAVGSMWEGWQAQLAVHERANKVCTACLIAP